VRELAALKQRSPAGGRWAGNAARQIEKMLHRETTILGAWLQRVKSALN
jgi:hypothetical protein